MSLDGALVGATYASGGLLLRLIQVALPVYQRREVVICGCNVPEIIVADIAKNDRLNFFSRQCLGINLIQLVFLQCGEKAFHSGIVIVASRATHALKGAIFFQYSAEFTAGKLTSAIGVENHASGARFWYRGNRGLW